MRVCVCVYWEVRMLVLLIVERASCCERSTVYTITGGGGKVKGKVVYIGR